ncbi:MAG: low molecular weight phosphotyrosine protein phosphatase [bacterium]|nr:low molecular weight phosphotyrosine protein phosphatase [bacterium]
MDAPGTVLFVCSGNTCRSPLAAALAAARWQGEPACASAGLDASPGCPATAESCDQARERGLDLARHRSRPLDPAVLEGTGWVLLMTPGQLARFRSRFPGFAGRVGLLGLPGIDLAAGGDAAAAETVDDPYRAGTSLAYARMADQVDRLVEAWTAHLQPGRTP